MSKQYLWICNDQMRIVLENVIKGIEFLEIQGLNLNNENKFNLLVTPVIPPVNQAFIQPQMEAPQPPKTDEVKDA